MNCDVASITGKSHRICEDYARCNSEWRHWTTSNKPEMLPLVPTKPYVIVADGCSSATDSDFGARILVKHAENFMTQPHPPNFNLSVIHAAYATAKSMGLHETSLDATLLVAQYVEDGDWKGVKVNTYGDGVVAARKRDGSLEIVSVSFPSGYPYYLSYVLSEERTQNLLKQTNGNMRRHERVWLDANGNIEGEKEECEFEGPETKMQGMISEYVAFGIFSDGVHSITTDNGSGPKVPFTDVIKRFMTFKGSKRGEFVQRTMNGFVKEATKLGWSNFDDVSMGVIYLDDATVSGVTGE